jgi:serine/threonine protein kinase
LRKQLQEYEVKLQEKEQQNQQLQQQLQEKEQYIRQVQTLNQQLQEKEQYIRQVQTLNQQLQQQLQEKEQYIRQVQILNQQLQVKEQQVQQQLQEKEQYIRQVQTLNQQLREKEQQQQKQQLHKSQFIRLCFERFTVFNAHTLRVAELPDFDLNNGFRFLSNGSNGAVSLIQTSHQDPLQRGVQFPTNKQVVIKTMFNYRKTVNTRDPTVQQKQKFDREYLVALQHPHWTIVNIYNYFRGVCIPKLIVKDLSTFDATLYHENTTYFTMEVCECSFEQWLKNKRTTTGSKYFFDPKRDSRKILLLALQLLLGLEHLDRNKIRHLDYKLDNLFVIKCRGGLELKDIPQVVLGDFGTARIGDVVALEHLFEGNQTNRAPEVLQPTDPQRVKLNKADLWSFGCVLFEVVEGNHPFYKEGQQNDLIPRICGGVIPNLSQPWLSRFETNNEQEKRLKQGLEQLLFNKLLVREVNQRTTVQEAVKFVEQVLWEVPEHISKEWLSEQEQKLYDELQQQQQQQRPRPDQQRLTVETVQMNIEQLLKANMLVRSRQQLYSEL